MYGWIRSGLSSSVLRSRTWSVVATPNSATSPRPTRVSLVTPPPVSTAFFEYSTAAGNSHPVGVVSTSGKSIDSALPSGVLRAPAEPWLAIGGRGVGGGPYGFTGLVGDAGGGGAGGAGCARARA